MDSTFIANKVAYFLVKAPFTRFEIANLLVIKIPPMASAAYQLANYSVREAASVTLEVGDFKNKNANSACETFFSSKNSTFQFKTNVYPNGSGNFEYGQVYIDCRIKKQDRPLFQVQWNISLINSKEEKQFTKSKQIEKTMQK